MVAVMRGGSVPTRTDFHEAIAARADRWYAACLRITRDRDLAEDAVQEALLSAWRKREQFRDDARLDTWIHRIAINAALQLVRRQKPGMFDALETDLADESLSPETVNERQELGCSLAVALNGLSDMERACFVLKHLEQWRLKEIADQLETGINTVKQALFRATRKLRGSDLGLKE